MTAEQAAFGVRLRREREAQDISLATVSDTTKIAQSLLASLERGDASNWPPGIYRRAFLREYAVAVGLPAEPIVAEFLRLFPESGAGLPDRIETPEGGLRLTLAPAQRWSVGTIATQAAAAIVDIAIVFAAGTALGKLLVGVGWSAIAMFAVAYYSMATAAVGRSPMLWLITAVSSRYADRARARVPVRPNSRELLHIVATAPRPARPPVMEAEHHFTLDADDPRIASR
jgi:transcriptional regulator with XRE-family HTH domain